MLVGESEAGLVLQLGRPPVERGGGNHFDLSAVVAHHVGVAVSGEMERRRSVPEMHMGDQTHLLQRVEEAVHGRDVHLGQRRLHLAGELLGGHMIGLVEQHAENRPALVGHATALLPNRLKGAIDCVGAGHPPNTTSTTGVEVDVTSVGQSAVATSLRYVRGVASRTISTICLVSALSITACGGDSASQPTPDASGDVQADARTACESGTPVADGQRIRISSTVAPITSIVANVAGGLADITGLVPEGTNSHTFEPAPSVAATLAQTDVLFANGLVLEEPTKDLATENLPDGAALCELGTAILPVADYIYDFSFPLEGGKPNPHLWTNPPMAEQYAETVRDVLVRMDPANADAYRDNATAYVARIEALDKAMVTATATVPAGQRNLLTYHDAYAYFAKTYGWTVIGAIQPSNFDEPTAKEVAGLIEQVRETGVPAIFGSEVFPSPVLEQIGAEAGVAYVDVLRDDDLPGEPGDPDHSFLGLMQFDYITMVEALGGDASALRAIDVGDVAVDTAEYPQ